VVVRAGQNAWADPAFPDFWRNAKAQGLPRGTYFFYDSRKDPVSQASLFFNQFKNDWPEMEIVGDYEESYGGPYGGWQNFKTFLDTLRNLGVPASQIAVYSGFYYWRDHSPQSNPTALAYFSQYKLWEAWYTTNPAVVQIPAPWTNVELVGWQYTSAGSGLAHGVETLGIDLNWWNMTPEQFDIKYGGVVPPPTGDTMIKGTVIGQVYFRGGPSNTFPNVIVNGKDGLFPGQIVLSKNKVNQWLELYKIDGILAPPNVWASSGPTGQYITVEIVPDEEPTPPPTEPPPLPPPPLPPPPASTREFVEQITMTDPDGTVWKGDAHFILTKQ